MMTNDERASLEVLRAEMNGKLDLLLERTSDLKSGHGDHEQRIRNIEEHGSTNAQEAVKEIKGVRVLLTGIQYRMWMAVGGLAVVVFFVNLGIAKHWF